MTVIIIDNDLDFLVRCLMFEFFASSSFSLFPLICFVFIEFLISYRSKLLKLMSICFQVPIVVKQLGGVVHRSFTSSQAAPRDFWGCMPQPSNFFILIQSCAFPLKSWAKIGGVFFFWLDEINWDSSLSFEVMN